MTNSTPAAHSQSPAGAVKPVCRKFHNNRWPLLTKLLVSKGWVEADPGDVADLAVFDEGHWKREADSSRKGKLEFFSRAYTDMLTNKKSSSIAISSGGCADVMTPTFTTLSEWEAEAKTQPPNTLWFFKHINSSNSKSIMVARTPDEGRQLLAIASAAPAPAEQRVMESMITDKFLERVRGQLRIDDGGVKSAGAACTPAVPSTDSLRRAIGKAFLKDGVALEDTMNNYIVQRGVERPLLIKGGRKFPVRIYVIAVVMPLESPGKTRLLDVYVSDLAIGRPQKEPFDVTSTDPASQYEDTSTLYVNMSDGSVFSAERWKQHLFPTIKETARRVTDCFHFLPEMDTSNGRKLAESAQFQSHFAVSLKQKTHPAPPVPVADHGGLAIMGWDFMIDEDEKPWLLEINCICNLQHVDTNATDTFIKTQLAQDFYNVVLGPLYDGTEPVQSEHWHQVTHRNCS